ncbi:MAG: zinc ribbon domain-containing protein [Candidatus Pacebacteria bacterium]|jgi:putative FmdB family regulatory protein|nr:zinc ribbon domain-containing protein [Candidatus Paceibacterota bacterium]
MPYYDYHCMACSHTFEMNMRISERKKPTEEPCPECSKSEIIQQLATPYHGDPWHFAGKKPDEGFKDRLKEIKKSHRGSTIDTW